MSKVEIILAVGFFTSTWLASGFALTTISYASHVPLWRAALLGFLALPIVLAVIVGLGFLALGHPPK